jgi:hypothetical protein
MALADVLEARSQAQADAQTGLVPVQPFAADAASTQLGAVRRPVLSEDSKKVLHDAWVENSLHSYGAPIDTADLLVGLLQAPTTGPVLEQFGITVERVRATKRGSDGYQLASRFTTVSTTKLAKTQQVGRVARLVAENSIVSGKPLIEPEDILEILAVDGLGWGMGIMEELGLNEQLLRESLASPQLLGDAMFSPAADYLARQQTGGASGLPSSSRAARLTAVGVRVAHTCILALGGRVAWILAWSGLPTDRGLFG